MNWETKTTLLVNLMAGDLTTDELNLIVDMMEFATENGFWDEGSAIEQAAWERLQEKVA